MNVFSSVGDLGDVLALLPSMRAAGGGKLILTYRQRTCRESLQGQRFDAIKPLLEAQDYVQVVEWQDEPKGVTHDVTNFRSACAHIKIESLLHWQARHLGLKVSTEPWLSAETNNRFSGRTVIARSSRYRNDRFPWRQILRQHQRALFVGLPSEHESFQREMATKVDFEPTEDFLEMAQIIAGCSLFIGNQSAPMWVALGLGVAIIQESFPAIPNTVLDRPNVRYTLDDSGLNAVVRSSLPPSVTAKPKPKSSTMFLVFPFNKIDQHKLVKLFRLLADFCEPQPFHCLLASAHTDGLEELNELAARIFQGKMVNHQKLITVHDSWPAAANGYFEQIALEIAAKTSESWMWIEPDCMILTKDGFKGIAIDYGSCGKRFYGMITPAGQVREGETMLGCGIYPGAFYAESQLCKYLTLNAEGELRNKITPRPFDAILTGETTQNCHQSTIMQDAWRSDKFKMEGGRIVFNTQADFGQDKFIRPGVVLVHGCKDDSLVDLMRSQWMGVATEFQPVIAGAPMAARGNPVRDIMVLDESAMLTLHTGETFSMTVSFARPRETQAAKNENGHITKKDWSTTSFQQLRKLATPLAKKRKLKVLRLKRHELEALATEAA